MKQIKEKIARTGLAALLAFSASTSKIKAEEPSNLIPSTQSAQLNESQIKEDFSLTPINLSAASTFKSDYVGTGGGIIGTGPVNQTYLQADLGKNLFLGVWTNYDFGDQALHEIDYSVGLQSKLFSIEDGPLKGDVSASISYQFWDYPSGLLGKPDHVLFSTLNYNGIENGVSANLSFIKRFTEGTKTDDNFFMLDVSKRFDVAKWDGNTVYISPNLRVAYNNNFYGVDGFAHITPSVSMGLSNKRYNLEFFVSQQLGLTDSVKDELYYGVRFGTNDLIGSLKDLSKIIGGKYHEN